NSPFRRKFTPKSSGPLPPASNLLRITLKQHDGSQGNVRETEPANTPHEALELARGHSGPIDVLLTDIVMPGLRGTELAQQVAELHPEVRIIFISGYAQSLPEAQIPPRASFLQKPFRFASLAEQLKLVTRKI
ncbi:MAG: response regulator, partial [Candidatus Acidiferrum sp.]